MQEKEEADRFKEGEDPLIVIAMCGDRHRPMEGGNSRH